MALLRAPGELLAGEVASQNELHNRFGGVVPEVASRNHLLALRPLIERVLHEAGVGLGEVSGLAATAGAAMVVGVRPLHRRSLQTKLLQRPRKCIATP